MPALAFNSTTLRNTSNTTCVTALFVRIFRIPSSVVRMNSPQLILR
jgi:hypothetical protein